MSTYVLIHGAWRWDKILPLLKQAGHTGIAPDLPGHGKDKTPIPEITLQGYVQRVCETVNAQGEKIITMDASHSPFFFAPEALVAHLTSL